MNLPEEGGAAAGADERIDPLANWSRPERAECPICYLTQPMGRGEVMYWTCCSKYICSGCVNSQLEAGGAEQHCPFCRERLRTSDEATDDFLREREMKLAIAGRTEAMVQIAGYYHQGRMGVRKDNDEALKWYRLAVEGGNGQANQMLGRCFRSGWLGLEKDDDKALEYLTKAADLGEYEAFAEVAQIYLERGDIEGMILNLRKAAICGVSGDGVSRYLRMAYQNGHMTKQEYLFTLREQQSAVDGMKSESRDRYNEKFGHIDLEP